ncbi:MAG: hypothetical protein GY830_00115 [Bacteroidetes bacterium]|nr:hypothetical protein [Bacteroidota bacterium]
MIIKKIKRHLINSILVSIFFQCNANNILNVKYPGNRNKNIFLQTKKNDDLKNKIKNISKSLNNRNRSNIELDYYIYNLNNDDNITEVQKGVGIYIYKRKALYKCPNCKKYKKTRRLSIEEHLPKCLGLKGPYKCKSCPKRFYARSNASKHAKYACQDNEGFTGSLSIFKIARINASYIRDESVWKKIMNKKKQTNSEAVYNYIGIYGQENLDVNKIYYIKYINKKKNTYRYVRL